MLQILGYFVTLIVGVTLGMMGSGGSILTVPNLVYLFGIDAVHATSYSLFIIGITSLIGSISKIKEGLVNFKLVILFGVPSVISMVLTRQFLMPQIPTEISFLFGVFHKDFMLMMVFAIVMILAAFSMITNKQQDCIDCGKKMEKNILLLIFQGLIIGFVSGILGAGGGFLIIPGLVIFAKVPMKNAVATSLFIVAINSIMGFGSDYQQFHQLNWSLLIGMTILSVIGIIIGNKLVKRIDAKRLKPIFGYFILVVAGFILIKEML